MVVTELVLYVFGVFISIIGGNPDKRISEGHNLFFLGFIGIIGGTPDKRISEGLFRRYFFYLGFL